MWVQISSNASSIHFDCEKQSICWYSQHTLTIHECVEIGSCWFQQSLCTYNTHKRHAQNDIFINSTKLFHLLLFTLVRFRIKSHRMLYACPCVCACFSLLSPPRISRLLNFHLRMGDWHCFVYVVEFIYYLISNMLELSQYMMCQISVWRRKM